jgi:maleylpyruvate isomerase
MTMEFDDVLIVVAASHDKVESALAALTDELARKPSLLPGWSRGHVVTHISRNADALNRLTLGVLTGKPQEMYPGGPDARNAAIEEGADRPASLLAADFRFAGSRTIDSLKKLNHDVLDTPVNWRKPITARDLPMLRWRELEVHHVDLGLGYTPADWSDQFVQETLETELPALAEFAPGVNKPHLPEAELLAWLVGRPTRDDLPALPSWPF